MNLKNLIKKPIYIFSSDIDWASETCIDITHKLFLKYDIKPTYFITHPSKNLEDYKKKKEAFLGSHPNFLKDSSHGKNYKQVIDYFDKFKNKLEPCFRSHRFYDVTDIKNLMVKKGYTYDSNILIPMKKLMPFRDYTGLLRIPCSWEDGTFLANMDLNFNKFKSFLDFPGICVINVHPLHMSINSPNMKFNRNLKNKLSRREMLKICQDHLNKYSFKDYGIRNFVEDLMKYIRKKKYTIIDLPSLYKLYVDFEKNNKIS